MRWLSPPFGDSFRDRRGAGPGKTVVVAEVAGHFRNAKDLLE
jgi:hypothetical protein